MVIDGSKSPPRSKRPYVLKPRKRSEKSLKESAERAVKHLEDEYGGAKFPKFIVIGCAIAIILFSVISSICSSWHGGWSANPNHPQGAATIAELVSNSLTVISALIIIMAALIKNVPLVFITTIGCGTTIILCTVVNCTFYNFYHTTKSETLLRDDFECESNSTASSEAIDDLSVAHVSAYAIFIMCCTIVLSALFILVGAIPFAIWSIIDDTNCDRILNGLGYKNKGKKKKMQQLKKGAECEKEAKEEEEEEEPKKSIIHFGCYLKICHRLVHIILGGLISLHTFLKAFGLDFFSYNAQDNIKISCYVEVFIAVVIFTAPFPLFFLGASCHNRLMVAGLCCVAVVYPLIVLPSISGIILISKKLLYITYDYENIKCDNGKLILETTLTMRQISGLILFFTSVFIAPFVYGIYVWNAMGIVRYYRDKDLHAREERKEKEEALEKAKKILAERDQKRMEKQMMEQNSKDKSMAPA